MRTFSPHMTGSFSNNVGNVFFVLTW
jgi:hypothetical protein